MSVHIMELIKAFRDCGHEVILVGPEQTTRSDFGKGGEFTDLVRKLLPNWVGESLELLYDRIVFRRLERAYLEHKPDFLYERYNLFLTAGKRLKEKYGLPFFSEVNSPLAAEREQHSGLSLKTRAKKMESGVWRAADVVLPVSAPLSEMVQQEGVPSARVEIISNGVDLEKFHPCVDGNSVRAVLGLSDEVVLGFTGFIRKWHGLDRVIAAMHQRKELHQTHLIVVGEGPVREELIQQAQQLGIPDRVHFVGVVARDQIARYIAAFDIALQPRVVPYASPLKLFEYMAMAKAIVAPRSANILEITGVDGALLFDMDSPDAMTDAIFDLITDQGQRLQFSKNAHKRIIDGKFTWKSNAERIVARAQTLINSQQSSMSQSRE